MKYKVINDWLYLTIDDQFNNHTITDLFNHFKLSKKSIHLLKQNKEYFLNNQFVQDSILKTNDILKIKAYEYGQNYEPHYFDLDIAYEDDFILVINKPAHINVHPGTSGEISLCNYVASHYNINNMYYKVKYIHRLDFDTTGLIIFCKCYFIQAYLDAQLAQKTIKRHYLALIKGHINNKKFLTINTFIARDRHYANKMRVATTGQNAITHYRLVKNINKSMSLVECQLDTGRTHQIRLHLSHINHPIIGDELYGTSSSFINRQALHAYKIKMTHPITNESLVIEIPLADDMKTK